MWRVLRIGSLIAVGVLVSAVAANADDLDMMQGKWRVKSMEVDGDDCTSLYKNDVWEFIGQELIFISPDRPRNKCQISINEKRNIDLHHRDESSPWVDRFELGIYRFNGRLLQLCCGIVSVPTAPPVGENRTVVSARPVEFGSKRASLITLERRHCTAVESLIADIGFARLDDLERMQGKWEVTQLQVGSEVDALRPKTVVWEISGCQLTITTPSWDKTDYTLTLDGKNHMDMTKKGGDRPNEVISAHGIYRFRRGSLQVCLGRPGRDLDQYGREQVIAKARPSEFDAKQGQLVTLRPIRD